MAAYTATDGDSYTLPYSYAYSHRHAYSYRDAHSHRDAHRDVLTDRHCHGDRDGDNHGLCSVNTNRRVDKNRGRAYNSASVILSRW